jgi:ubiquinone/menaquinone biosynthesis C-methylase UbiE
VNNQSYQGYTDYYTKEDPQWRWLGALDKAANIVALCSPFPHRSILDIGAGEGSILKRLSDNHFGDEFHALEISTSGIELTKKREIPGLISCQIYDGYSIPFADQIFDLAILSHVIEHVEYPRRLLHEAGRIARYVFIEVPLEDTIRLKPDFTWDKVGHINSYSAKTIRRLLQTCNFNVLKQTVTNPSLAVHRYRSGTKGSMTYAIRQIFLKLAPRMAVYIFTYHSSLICQPM